MYFISKIFNCLIKESSISVLKEQERIEQFRKPEAAIKHKVKTKITSSPQHTRVDSSKNCVCKSCWNCHQNWSNWYISNGENVFSFEFCDMESNITITSLPTLISSIQPFSRLQLSSRINRLGFYHSNCSLNYRFDLWGNCIKFILDWFSCRDRNWLNNNLLNNNNIIVRQRTKCWLL